jgi:hypothetical protein
MRRFQKALAAIALLLGFASPIAAQDAPPSTALIEQIGFSDPVIDELALLPNCSLFQQSSTEFLDKTYTAYIVLCEGEGDFLLFYVTAPVPEFLHREQAAVIRLELAGISNSRLPQGWRDFNGDQFPEILITKGTMGDLRGYDYQVTAAGGVEELTGLCGSPAGLSIKGLVDLNGDGDLELLAFREWRPDPLSRWGDDIELRIFEWDNCQFEEISASIPRRYESYIDWLYLLERPFPPKTDFNHIVILDALRGLISCDIMGRREECWSVFWSVTDPERFDYDAGGDQQYREWQLLVRETLLQQYEAGEPFSPPDFKMSTDEP